MSRKQRYSKQQIQQALVMAAGMVTTAAGYLGCAPSTVYDYLERYPDLRVTRQIETDKLGDRAEATLHHLALGEFDGKKWAREPNVTALIFLLKTKFHTRGYSERLKIDGRLDLGVLTQIADLAEQNGTTAGELFNELVSELGAGTGAAGSSARPENE